MTDQDNLRDKIADGVLRMHRIIGTTGRTGRVVCCSCDRTWRDHAQYQRHLAQAIIDDLHLESYPFTRHDGHTTVHVHGWMEPRP